MSLGLGVMIGLLSSNKETVTAIKKSLGKQIESVKLSEDILQLYFSDGSRLNLRDDGQSCCESRYMTADKEDFSYYAGSKLMDIYLSGATVKEDENETHEIQFLNVKTSKGVFQVATHVEHNGYYGGFLIVASLNKKEDAGR